MERSVLAAGSLLAASVIALAVGGAAWGTSASRSQIAIHEQGTDHVNQQGTTGAVRGKFTIDLALTPFGPDGTTVIYAIPAATRKVNGQVQVPFVATDHLTSKTGRLTLAVKGTHFDVNNKLSPSGVFVGPKAEYGTWRIEAATGIYQGWKGGGNWASVAYGYGNVQPYSVEWDGFITR